MATGRKQATQDVHGFPLMSNNELHDCLLACGISVTADDIAKPSAQTTQMIYAQLVEGMMGAPMDSMEGPKSTILGMMEYKDLYGDALQFTMFYRHCRSLALICGVNYFNLSDLTRPDSTRLRSILSGIMNFAKFRESRTHFQMTLQQRLQTQTDKTAQLKKEVHKLEDDIEHIKEKNAADKPKTEEAKRVNEELEKELSGYQTEQTRGLELSEKLKQERVVLSERMTNNAHEIGSLQIKHSSAKSRLVQSPERIKRNISSMSTDLTAEKTSLANYQRKARELQNRLEIIGNLERDLRDLIELSKGIENRKSKLEEAKRAKLGVQAKMYQKKNESQSLEGRLEQLDRQIKNAQDKVNRQIAMSEDMRERAAIKLDSVKTQYIVKSKDRNVWQRKRDAIKADQNQLEAEMEAFTVKHENELNLILEEYAIVRQQADDYMDTMTEKLGLQVRA